MTRFLSRCSLAWRGMDKPAYTHASKGQAPRFPRGWLKLKRLVYLDTPTMVGWTIGGWVYLTSSARKITHLSILLALTSNACLFLEIRCVVRRIFAICGVRIWFGIRSGGCFVVIKLV